MTLDPQASLAAAEIALYAPLLLLSLPVTYRHTIVGHNRSWLYLPLLSALRLASASIELHIQTARDFSSGLIEAATITSAVGTAPLLLVQLAFVKRVNDRGARAGGGPVLGERAFRLIGLLSLAALVLGIVGGVEAGEGNVDLGRALRGASAVMFLAIGVVQAGLAARLVRGVGRGWVAGGVERALAWFALAVAPFVLVRLIYSVASAFATPGSVFYFLDVDVYVQAFMLFLMEVITIAIYIWAGFVTPPEERHNAAVDEGAELASLHSKPQQYRQPMRG